MNQTTLAQQALNEGGIVPKKEKARLLANGCQTLAPIIGMIIKKGAIKEQGALSGVLNQIKSLNDCILRKAVDAHFKILPAHYVAINRLAISLFCDSYLNGKLDDPNDIANCVVSLFDLDEIHAECIKSEVTDNEFSLQFIAVSKLATVVTKYLTLANNHELDDDNVTSLIISIIEIVDKQIDSIYDDFIEPGETLFIRKHLLEQAAVILESIFSSEQNKNNDKVLTINIHLVKKRFEFAYETFIEAITLTAKIRE